jgi:hypothetical protein
MDISISEVTPSNKKPDHLTRLADDITQDAPKGILNTLPAGDVDYYQLELTLCDY